MPTLSHITVIWRYAMTSFHVRYYYHYRICIGVAIPCEQNRVITTYITCNKQLTYERIPTYHTGFARNTGHQTGAGGTAVSFFIFLVSKC